MLLILPICLMYHRLCTAGWIVLSHGIVHICFHKYQFGKQADDMEFEQSIMCTHWFAHPSHGSVKALLPCSGTASGCV